MKTKLAILILAIILSAFYTSSLAQDCKSNNHSTYYRQSTPQQYLPQTQNYRTPTYPSYDLRKGNRKIYEQPYSPQLSGHGATKTNLGDEGKAISAT